MVMDRLAGEVSPERVVEMLEAGAQPLQDLIAALHTKLMVAELERHRAQPGLIEVASSLALKSVSSRASTGIGRATALRMDADGWRVFAGVRREEDAAALREAASERLVPLMLDVTEADQIAAAAEQIGEAVGEAGSTAWSTTPASR